jgi:hypothetical protein
MRPRREEKVQSTKFKVQIRHGPLDVAGVMGGAGVCHTILRMRAAPPPLDVKDWPSHAYWRESDARVKQLWYVSFCLMMSSVQDRLTGLALQESGNLNWATTAFYYSGVHAGRLVCFVCTGDYPTSHTTLAALLAPTQAPRTPRPARPFYFDWLDKFTRYVGTSPVGAAGPVAPSPRPDRDAIVRAIDTNLPGVRPAFDRFAPLLATFKNLRNDCNYEALLIAHEVNHFEVTEGFNDLVASAASASGLAVDLAVAAYSEHVQRAACFGASRPQFHAAHAQYLSGRFSESLQQKFNGSTTAMTELQRIRDGLDWSGAPAGIDPTFLAPIMYDYFSEKRGLMQRWRDDIQTL